MQMAWGHGEAPTCHVLIYPFLSPEHRQQAIKDADPSIQTGYPLPQSDIYHLEHVDVALFQEHMQKLDLCITFYANANNNYRMIHDKLLMHNATAGKPQIPGLKTDDLANLSFQNMGWCFLQLMSHKGDPSLLIINKKLNEGQATIDHFIHHASLESKFLPKCGKNHSAVLGQFTLVIENISSSDLRPHLPQSPKQELRGGSLDENSLPCLHACRGLPPNHLTPELTITAGIPLCPQLTDDATSLVAEPPVAQPNIQSTKRPAESRSPSPDHSRMRPLLPIDSSAQLPPLPLPPPYYAGEIWPLPDDAEWAQGHPMYISRLLETVISLLPDTICLMGPNVGSLADAVLKLCRFYMMVAWDKNNKTFFRKIEGLLKPQFDSPNIHCENWDEIAKFRNMKITILPSQSHGDGINKMVFREALRRALENTNLYTSLPNDSSYFTATFCMMECTERETHQWRAQGLLLALCSVTFRMPPLPPYDVGFKQPDPEKSKLQNRLVLKLILLSHLLTDWSNGINAMRQGFGYNFGHNDYLQGLDLLDLIQFDHGYVRTDAFCSTPCDWGYEMQPNGAHLPLYECMTYLNQDLERHGPHFLVMATSLPYMPAVPEERIKLFRTSTCFNVIRLKVDMALCSLLAGQATPLFPNFEACLDFWLFDDDQIITLV
ncbi:uncharacterized protein EV420DRAFT_1478750 [Desarmillaria tabescens]|uniref:Uncharacterized protein n=1 Tax=Armillaria tabescens TaxID=1929756 RepID=A0AA39N7B3_ARMTA|nr:uncharacterized protein EV420DRAFT_1478750 [Desarmillaria tabescens]KAK0460233.1 hypothetical protein EV420DRAFT_1478750 [Desarmillaria tabescens]